VDDTLALLLALSASPEDLVVELISVTFGNVPVEWYVDLSFVISVPKDPWFSFLS